MTDPRPSATSHAARLANALRAWGLEAGEFAGVCPTPRVRTFVLFSGNRMGVMSEEARW